MTPKVLAVFLAASGVVLMGDSEFDHVVHAIEIHYQTKRTHIPFLGLANVFVKVARPAGTSEFKLAIFEDLKSIGSRDEQELDHFMRELSSGRLHRGWRRRRIRCQRREYVLQCPLAYFRRVGE